MTIDISNLSQEKRAFLKAHPDLLNSLEQEAGRQGRKVQVRKKKLSKGKSRWQRQLEEAEEKARKARSKAHRSLREVDVKYRITLSFFKGLVCPVCGKGENERIHGNKGRNGHPWCVRCNSPLIPKNKLEKWKKMAKVKVVRNSLKGEFKRRGLDF